MAGRRGILGGILGLGATGPELIKEAVRTQQTGGRMIQGMRALRSYDYLPGVQTAQGMDLEAAAQYTSAMDSVLNTPYVQGLFFQNHALRDLVRDLGEAPCVMGHKSNAPWFKRMATKKAIETHSNMVDKIVKDLMAEIKK